MSQNQTNTRPARFVSLILFLLMAAPAFSQLARRPNTTLTLPFEPVSGNGDIVLTESFPGLTFQAPVCIRSLPGETNKLFIVERYGRIMVLNDLSDPKPEIFM